MPPQLLSAAVQIILAALASGVIIKLFTLRQDRRKIAGEASTQEANAASTLSGAALQMVEAAQRTANEAEKRADHANDAAEKCREQSNEMWTELNKARWEIHWLQIREKVLEAALAQAHILVPPAPIRYGGIPSTPPPLSPDAMMPMRPTPESDPGEPVDN